MAHLLPSHVPGVRELQQMCANARRVARLCDTLGIAPDDEDDGGELVLLDELAVARRGQREHVARDGDWILPED